MRSREVLEVLGCSSAMLHYWERYGMLQPIRLNGRASGPRWYRSDVERLAAKRTAASRARASRITSVV